METKEKLYLGGDAYAAAAVYIKDGTGAWQIYYIGRDYLGSITHVIDAAGTVKEELSYDAWGRLRNPVNQELYAADAQASVLLGGRGYTGHEHLAMFGLINMNARLYDPVLGRFLSPDPYVQAPDLSQNFNRYSYALNNPLRYNDPSGEFIPILAAAIMGAYINYSMQMLSGNVNSIGDAFKSLGVGAAAGAAGAATGGIISGVGFVAGAASGAISGFSSGMVLGAGNAWANGAGFAQGLGSGLKSGLLGAGTGALLGGVASGIESVRHGGNFLTGKGYYKIDNSIFSTDLGLGGDTKDNIANLEKIKKELGWKPGKFGLNEMSIEGQPMADNNFSSYYRLPNGILQNVDDAGNVYTVGGFVVKRYANLLQTKLEMYLSNHTTLDALKRTVNHELIHVYHYGKFGNEMDGDKMGGGYSEYSASYYTSTQYPAYNIMLLRMPQYSSAFLRGYDWPSYLLKIK